jgi:multimeric flavodoxin WrbA
LVNHLLLAFLCVKDCIILALDLCCIISSATNLTGGIMKNMKVMLVNCSPHKAGTTARALDEVAAQLEKNGIEVGRFWVGASPIAGCIGCAKCADRAGKCIFDDAVNEFNAQAGQYDGFVFGSSVHYAAATGAATSFMDRAFYSQALGGLNLFAHKPGAAVVTARRGGMSSTWDQMNKYFGILQMPIITSTYWNMVYGCNAQEAERDEEGLRTMRVLANNMAWHLKCRAAAEEAGITPPEPEPPARTNFIR